MHTGHTDGRTEFSQTVQNNFDAILFFKSMQRSTDPAIERACTCVEMYVLGCKGVCRRQRERQRERERERERMCASEHVLVRVCI